MFTTLNGFLEKASIFWKGSSSIVVATAHIEQDPNGSANEIFFLRTLFCDFLTINDKVLKKIFSFLNHSDLVQCRAVQRRWKKILSRDRSFLEKTVYVVNIVKSYNVATSSLIYNDLTIYAQMPYLHGRFQYIDSNFLKEPRKFVLKNSDNEKYVPEGKLESSNHTHTTEFEEFNAGNAIFAMKHLEIYEIRCLSNVTSILKKFIGYGNQALACLKITYYPPAERGSTRDDIKSDSADFCRELKTLISNCASSLQTLCLDVQHEQTLNFIGYHVCKHLQALGPRLDLTEFKLTPSLACWVHKPGLMPTMGIAMTMKDMTNGDGQKCLITAAAAMARFLESQKNLKILALPCIEHPEAFSSCFHTVLTRLPAAPTIEYLAVPSAGFLPLNLLHVFPNLKALKVGGTCCQDSTSGWEIFQYYTKEQLVNTASADTPDEANQDGAIVRREFAVMTPQPILAITQTDNDFYERLEMMKKMEELYLTTTVIPKNFKIVMSRLINLTTLNVSSGPDSPVIRDDDLQACILHLKRLHNLLIGCADELTDYGISGIPNEYCSATFKNQRYQKDGVYENVWSSEKVTGRPLSDLKGKIETSKIGSERKNKFTDIGIAYGLAFQELKCCHLPYSDYVTSWGIERFNVMNPSLEAFGLCGVSELTKDAFLSSRRTHTRLGKGDASRTGYYSEHVSGIDNFSLVLALQRQ
ncbi:hypothetical protein Ocin01_13268 [Orchesella cincta]|uniref:F-box domain-containing protein n=1 Tax=Orchesella cincta TaxID=48709 RepID=A0A1D2MKA6_ORCCI|nr:hypothetical protein Ocin01_13268 [Orchesella cincta]